MSEERLQEIKDSIELQYTLAKAKGYDNALLFTNEEEELIEEIERLKEDITITNDYIGKIQKENNILKENAKHNDKVVDKAKWNEMLYKSRIDKAIEYIESKRNQYYFVSLADGGIELIDILKGSDKEC